MLEQERLFLLFTKLFYFGRSPFFGLRLGFKFKFKLRLQSSMIVRHLTFLICNYASSAGASLSPSPSPSPSAAPSSAGASSSSSTTGT